MRGWDIRYANFRRAVGDKRAWAFQKLRVILGGPYDRTEKLGGYMSVSPSMETGNCHIENASVPML